MRILPYLLYILIYLKLVIICMFIVSHFKPSEFKALDIIPCIINFGSSTVEMIYVLQPIILYLNVIELNTEQLY